MLPWHASRWALINLDGVVCLGQPWLLFLSQWLPLQRHVPSPSRVLLDGKKGDYWMIAWSGRHMFRVLPFGLGMRLVTIPSQYFLIGTAKEPYLDVSQQHVASKHFSGVSILPVMVTLSRIITGGVEGGAEESHESQHREEKHRASKQTNKQKKKQLWSWHILQKLLAWSISHFQSCSWNFFRSVSGRVPPHKSPPYWQLWYGTAKSRSDHALVDGFGSSTAFLTEDDSTTTGSEFAAAWWPCTQL